MRAACSALLLATALGAGIAPPALLPLPSSPNASAVHTVHLVFSHHLDVGLNEALRFVGECEGFATKIVQEYFDDFIPKAIKLAKKINGELGAGSAPAGPTDDGRFAYTIHPWIGSLYVDCVPWDVADGCALNPGKLRCPSAAQVGAFDDAVRRGDLLWADSPFNVNAGVVGEPGMLGALFDIAAALNERYNISKPRRVWSNVDVPGFTRSAIPALRRAGAGALSVCANVGNQGPGGPNHTGFVGPTEFVGPANPNATMWRWHDPASDEEILVLYHKAQRDSPGAAGELSSEYNTYGGYTRLDNTIVTTGGVALASYIAADNTGPPSSAEEARAIFKVVRKIFPNAEAVFGSTWDAFVADVTPAEVAALPRHSSEWGDLWVTGATNDPGRLARYRAIARARAACVGSGACQARDPVVRNFTRFAAKNAEHTQGVEGGGNQPGSQLCIWFSLAGLPCPGDSDWKNEAFTKVHNGRKNIFPGADDSWLESRKFTELALQAVPDAHPLSPFLKTELAALVPQSPAALPALQPVRGGAGGPTVTCNGTTLAFSSTGSLNLTFGHGGSSWSRLMDLRYISFRMADKKGVVCDKPTCPNPVAGAWAPSLLASSVSSVSVAAAAAAGARSESCHVVLELAFNDTLHGDYGAPARVTAAYSVDPARRRVNVSLTWRNKTVTRLHEAMTVFNRPAPRAGFRWEMDKLGEWIPSANVTEGGEQYQHAVWSGVRYAAAAAGTDKRGAAPGLWLSTLDAGLVCPVLNKAADATLDPETALSASCFDYHIQSTNPRQSAARQLKDAEIDGLGFNLHANRFEISGFPQWYPFGVGDQYQQQDETTQFRFVVEER